MRALAVCVGVGLGLAGCGSCGDETNTSTEAGSGGRGPTASGGGDAASGGAGGHGGAGSANGGNTPQGSGGDLFTNTSSGTSTSSLSGGVGGGQECAPVECAPDDCGSKMDDCGNVVVCGTCPTGGDAPQFCDPSTHKCRFTDEVCAGQTFCGSIVDACQNIVCQKGCVQGEVCVADASGLGVCEPAQRCQPAECTENQCGTLADGCTGILDCGECENGFDCIANTCVDPNCVPNTCEFECGVVLDGCGGFALCGPYGGGCAVGKSCDTSTHTCVPSPVCQALGLSCSIEGEPAVDPCTGAEVDCGRCDPGQYCSEATGDCEACPGDDCQELFEQGLDCGTYVDEQCGQTHVCSTCGSTDSCTAAGTCCPAGCPDDQTCGTAEVDACGGTVSCGTCVPGTACDDGTCGACDEPGCAVGQECGQVVACGALQLCGPNGGICPPNQACQNGDCCTPNSCPIELPGGFKPCGEIENGDCPGQGPAQCPCGANQFCAYDGPNDPVAGDAAGVCAQCPGQDLLCPLDYCGPITDPQTGCSTYCGCPDGDVCASGNTCCTPDVSGCDGATCGTTNNGCGMIVNCGDGSCSGNTYCDEFDGSTAGICAPCDPKPSCIDGAVVTCNELLEGGPDPECPDTFCGPCQGDTFCNEAHVCEECPDPPTCLEDDGDTICGKDLPNVQPGCAGTSCYGTCEEDQACSAAKVCVDCADPPQCGNQCGVYLPSPSDPACPGRNCYCSNGLTCGSANTCVDCGATPTCGNQCDVIIPGPVDPNCPDANCYDSCQSGFGCTSANVCDACDPQSCGSFCGLKQGTIDGLVNEDCPDYFCGCPGSQVCSANSQTCVACDTLSCGGQCDVMVEGKVNGIVDQACQDLSCFGVCTGPNQVCGTGHACVTCTTINETTCDQQLACNEFLPGSPDGNCPGYTCDGTCPAGRYCSGNDCLVCTPPTCVAGDCGTKTNACGASTNCGNTCASGVCDAATNGHCCAPACTDAQGGDLCGAANVGTVCEQDCGGCSGADNYCNIPSGQTTGVCCHVDCSLYCNNLGATVCGQPGICLNYNGCGPG